MAIVKSIWKRWRWLFLLILIPICLQAEEDFTLKDSECEASDKNPVQQELSAMGVTLCLQNPSYSEGVLKTDSGGVVTAPGIRIQARHLEYRRQEGGKGGVIEADGDLIIDFRNNLFIGDQLTYELNSHSGTILNGRLAMPPWYLGAEQIELCSDGTYILVHGYITTAEGSSPDWEIHTAMARLSCDRYLYAKDVSFRIKQMSLLWLPSFRANLDTIFDIPIRYNFRWGGHEGPRVGISYELYSWEHFRMRGLLNYRLRSGLGGGIETSYRSLDHRLSFNTISYMAHDITRTSHKSHTRYRFQGCYNHQLNDDRTLIKITYDKLSDRDMASDYADKGLVLETGQRTGCLIRHQEPNCILNFVTNVRINDFQTLKQELPTIATNWRPFNVGKTGFIYDVQTKFSYLDFVYADFLTNVHDYHSTRYELRQHLYRTYSNEILTFTPEATAVTILYGNSPQRDSKFLAAGLFQATLHSDLHRYYCDGNDKHVATPYLRFTHFTNPSVSPDEHYIFDIEDGWYRVTIARMGLLNNYYRKHADGYITRLANVDLFTQCFFDPNHGARPIPKVYATSTFTSVPTLKHVLSTAWDLQHNELDHCNIRTEWTISSNIAVALEFRHRSPYHWRKADRTNYVLDFFQSEKSLLKSTLSDRRDTVLAHLFWRFNPNWALELQSRSGWSRRCEPRYNEFEVDLYGTLRSAWQLRFSYQQREDDRRFAVYVSLGLSKPDCDSYLPCVEF